MPEIPISFQELNQADHVEPAPCDSLQASDGTNLAYRCYVPSTPRAAVLFYHGAGAHSAAGCQFIGDGLKSQFDLAVYTPDIRGHGASQGERGDAPGPLQVLADITAMIQRIRRAHPGLPLIVGGHSSGAGLVLNYAGWPERERVNGYLFLSPQLGPHALTDRPISKAPFVKVDDAAFVAYVMSGGRLRGNHYAVTFNYPPEILHKLPDLVTAVTVNMAVALTPIAPKEQFKALDRPFGMWIGSDDELFIPEKVMAFASLAKSVSAGSQAGVIAGEKHLSILISAYGTIGPWIDELLLA